MCVLCVCVCGGAHQACGRVGVVAWLFAGCVCERVRWCVGVCVGTWV